MLNERDPSVTLRPPEKSSKSYAWGSDCFLIVYHNNVKQNFVYCKICSNLITYNSIHGTGSLLRHICYRRSLNDSSGSVTTLLNETTSTARAGPSLSSVGPNSTKGSDLSQHKKHIESLIAKGDPAIRLQAPANIKSEIWSNGNFKTIYRNDVKLDFVMCMICNSLITYRSKTGTASLLRHSCMRGVHLAKREAATVKDKDQSISEIEYRFDTEQDHVSEHEPDTDNGVVKYVELEEMPMNIGGSSIDNDQNYYVEFPEEYKEEAAKLLQCFLYKDMHPLSISSGSGFYDFGQYLINLGAEYGRVSIGGVLENKDLIHLGDNFVNILQNMLKNKFAEHKIALSCDIWTDSNRRANFLTVYGHYIDEQFKLKKVNLSTENCMNDVSEINYKELLDSILVQYFQNNSELQVFLSKTTIVMPSELIAQFQQLPNIHCACWSLNIIVQKILELPMFKYLIPEDSRDNWLSALEYVESIERLDPTIQKLLNILYLFKLASNRLSTEGSPTINEVCILNKKLHDYFNNLEDKRLAQESKEFLANHFHVSNLHKIATFLDPRFKSLKFMSAEDKTSVINMASKMISSEDINGQILQQDPKPSTSTSRSKTKFLLKSEHVNDLNDSTKYLIEYMDISEELDETHDEIDTYLNLKYNEIYSANILEFWESRYDLPRLRQLAKEILCIPASSVVTEKLFAEDAINFAKRRLNMEIENIKEMLFVHENYDMLSTVL